MGYRKAILVMGAYLLTMTIPRVVLLGTASYLLFDSYGVPFFVNLLITGFIVNRWFVLETWALPEPS